MVTWGSPMTYEATNRLHRGWAITSSHRLAACHGHESTWTFAKNFEGATVVTGDLVFSEDQKIVMGLWLCAVLANCCCWKPLELDGTCLWQSTIVVSLSSCRCCPHHDNCPTVPANKLNVWCHDCAPAPASCFLTDGCISVFLVMLILVHVSNLFQSVFGIRHA